MSRRYRLLTAGVLYASAQTPLRSRIVPAANTNTFPGVFTGMVNQLAEYRRADRLGAGTTSTRCGRNPPAW